MTGDAPHPSVIVRVAANHDGVVPRRPGKDTIVTNMVLNVVDDGTLKDPAER